MLSHIEHCQIQNKEGFTFVFFGNKRLSLRLLFQKHIIFVSKTLIFN
jgi:hypothetical protein